ncbi:MAG: Do family serine endopeptidase [Polyangiaceae bacterium]|nr:Do family serine endopeptidase [Polyangiaceae bacterium]
MNRVKSGVIRASVISGSIGALVAGGVAWAVASASGEHHDLATAQAAPNAAVAPSPNAAAMPSDVVADVAERAMKSVVSVSATKVMPTGMGSGFPGPAPFFFGLPAPRREAQGLGSGVFVRSDGIVLTNHHVVEGAKEIRVTTYDRRELPAVVLGSDEKSDLAVLRVKGNLQGLTPLPFGRSSSLRLGQTVLAIGNPFGVGQTVTQGIVSAKGRADLGITANEDFIQTDAAINPGNSGGALVDLKGQLVGINTAILSRTGGNVGIGFAIPSDMVKPIMEALISKGQVDRGWLGVGIQDVDSEMGEALELGSRRGVLIAEVRPDSPAERAGLKPGDVVTRVGATQVQTTGELRNAVALAGANKKVELTILRDGKERTISVALGKAPDREDRSAESGSGQSPASNSLDGFTVQPLDRDARQQLHVPARIERGVVVAEVEPGSAAARTGLRPGDVILEVDRRPVDGLQSFEKLWKGAGDKKLLVVYRQGRTLFLVTRR